VADFTHKKVDDGREVVAFGRRNTDDRGETFPGWWKH